MALACGLRGVEPLEGGTGTSSGSPHDPQGSTTRAEADDGAETKVDSVDLPVPHVNPSCPEGPEVRWQHGYDGSAERTEAGALARGPDGTFYMGGTWASEDDVERRLWIAAAAPDGSLLWEQTAVSMPSNRVVDEVPVIEALVLVDDVLFFAGSSAGRSYSDEPVAWHGRMTVEGELLDLQQRADAAWYGAAVDDDGAVVLAGRSYAPEGARVTRHDDVGVLWDELTVGHDDVDAAVLIREDVFMAGRHGDHGWIGRRGKDSGDLSWEHSMLDVDSLATESGELLAITRTDELVIAAGDMVRIKPTSDGGSIGANEIVVMAWSFEGDLQWSWQRGTHDYRVGSINALTVSPEGTIYASGRESSLAGNSTLFAAALSPDGSLLATIDEETPDAEETLVSIVGRGLAAGDDGQLFVLADRRSGPTRTTMLLELCL